MSLRVFLMCLLFVFPGLATAQGFQVAFGSMEQDADTPVEVTAESLSIDQENFTAKFKGDVVIVQGAMRMTAPEVDVFYNQETQGIARLVASGGVLIVNDRDAAEAENADYDLDAGTIEMTGNVLLTQGPNAVSSERMTIDLDGNTAEMHGRVRTVLKTESDQ